MGLKTTGMPACSQPLQFTVGRCGAFVERTARRFGQLHGECHLVFRFQVLDVTFGKIVNWLMIPRPDSNPSNSGELA
jgi:hypothetical protein